MKPKIDGTWFEFFHHSKVEGQYWNPQCRNFTEAQWRQLLDCIASCGMEYLVLLCSSLCYCDHAESYFPGGPYPFPEDMACKNPMEVLMDQTSRLGLKVFMSCGFYGDWTKARDNMRDTQVRRRAFDAMKRLNSLYGDYPSFYGWYLPDEIGIDEHFPSFFIDYVNDYRAYIRHLTPDKPLLIAPYGVAKIKFDSVFVEQLRSIDCEFIAYQDGVGIANGCVEAAKTAFRKLKAAHDTAGRSQLWADMEVFRFEGPAYRSALLPADPQRIRAQLAAISPYVEKILVYQYQGNLEHILTSNSTDFLNAKYIY